jgi:hypothetical protein
VGGVWYVDVGGGVKGSAPWKGAEAFGGGGGGGG